MSERVVPNFLPSRSGLHYANRWPHGPTVRFGPLDPRIIGVGDAANGLCGGMVFTVRDLFEAGITPPADTEPPANGSPRFKSIVRRQVQSLDWLKVPVRFYARTAFGSLVGGGLAKATFEDEWPKIRREIDEGRLAMLGLIRVNSRNPFKLTGNHQVVAYGYAEDGRGVTLRLYDPNWPDNDTVTTTLHLDQALHPTGIDQSTRETLLGYFLAPFKSGDVRAWR